MTTYAYRSGSDSARRRERTVRPFGPEDNGKQIVTPRGDVVGSIVRVRGGEAYVAPTAGLLEGCGSWLTGTWDEHDAFALDPGCVDAVLEDRIVLSDAAVGSLSDRLRVQK
ncbi:MAG: hypothetical protein ACQET5_12890 [Halobacteriota archaeon]|uniref:hypothetical protein n=1 Tax=Natronomonas sp. TaxID=2184060 RepID=UPI003976B44F